MMESCPICGKLPDAATRPFCSPRCANVDLGRWLTGGYMVPGSDGEAASDRDPDRLDPAGSLK